MLRGIFVLVLDIRFHHNSLDCHKNCIHRLVGLVLQDAIFVVPFLPPTLECVKTQIIYKIIFDFCLRFIKNNNLPNDIHNKAIQKICESQRIDKETKIYLKKIKK